MLLYFSRPWSILAPCNFQSTVSKVVLLLNVMQNSGLWTDRRLAFMFGVKLGESVSQNVENLAQACVIYSFLLGCCT